MNLNFFNRKKQFMVRLHRNNLFFGGKGKSVQEKKGIISCFACGNHPEYQVETLLNCSRSNSILQFLTRVLKRAGILNNRCQIDIFIFKRYPIGSVENITLMFTWKFVFNSKFSSQTLLCVPYAYALKHFFCLYPHGPATVVDH